MAHLTGKVVFKLLLIIAMLIQPIANAYAMAGMTHSQHAKSAAGEQRHAGHHAMHAAGDHLIVEQDVPDAQHKSHEHASNSDMNDCCDTSACCPAAIVDSNSLDHIPATSYATHLHISLEGVTLPSKIKPPQRIFS